MSADEFVQKGEYLISKEEDAQEKARDMALKSLPGVKHIGLEGVAKFFFECGWNRGVEYGRKDEGKK